MKLKCEITFLILVKYRYYFFANKIENLHGGEPYANKM